MSNPRPTMWHACDRTAASACPLLPHPSQPSQAAAVRSSYLWHACDRTAAPVCPLRVAEPLSPHGRGRVRPEYLWPDFHQHNGRVENDGVPLWTRYVRTKRALYEVRPVEQVIFVPRLVVPPAFNEPGPGAREYRVLNEDVYGNF